MADLVTSQIYDGEHNFVITMNNLSDGTGENLVKKIDVATMNPDPTIHLVLWHAEWVISEGSGVDLFWEGAVTNRLLLALSQHGDDRQYSRFGGLRNDASNPTGNVLLSTVGFIANSSYSITLEFKKGGIFGQNV